MGLTPQTVGDRPICGRLDDQPWIAAILADHTEPDSLAALARMLQDACYLVLSFLSGARDSEIKHLKRGGLRTECDADGTPYRWKMHSLAFKAEDDPAGVPAVWSIGEPLPGPSQSWSSCSRPAPTSSSPALPTAQGSSARPSARC
ncbi:hypothetical protein OG842_00195 [Streptomyces sp. NBC_00376]|uniref:hypothetical protein n=1 Tax=Streptomyces sp. NBC_00376 TaxID=2975730 RepID=UPI002E211E26